MGLQFSPIAGDVRCRISKTSELGCEMPGLPEGRRRTFVRTLLLAPFAILLLSPDARSGSFYLPLAGPALLRFAPKPANPSNFKWPQPGGATNQTEIAALSGPILTNSTSSALPQTNTTDFVAQSHVLTALPDASLFQSPLDANPSSASNLLLLTPQMLAEFFRANFDQIGLRPLTNGLNGIELPFNPPTPKPAPSSEATYQVQ